MKKSSLIALAVIAVTTAWATEEADVKLMTLGPPLNTPAAQLSGLTWCGDELLLLPQRPRFDASLQPSLFTVNKSQIVNAAKGVVDEPIHAKTISFRDNALRAGLTGFDGYEAIVCRDKELWLAIETKVGEEYFTTSIVKAQRLEPNEVKVHHEVHSSVESGSGIWNLSDETLVLAPDALITIHEANAATEDPSATAISLLSGKQKRISIPPIPYRITDATELDEANRFWVINYQWQDDKYLIDDEDWIAAEYPLGASHRLEKNVERLIEFELTETGILRTDTPPIYLKLSNEEGRNWEGIVRLEDLGFLLVSDEFPATYFGFVAY